MPGHGSSITGFLHDVGWPSRRFSTTARTAIAGLVLTSLAATPLRAVSTNNAVQQQELDTEHLFGFVEGADIGALGEKEFVNDSTLRAGKASGSFATVASEFEVKYTISSAFRISGAAVLAYYDAVGIPGIDDGRRAGVQSAFLDARLHLLDRNSAPVGVTLSVEPHWGFLDETSGVANTHFGTEAVLLLDRELVPDRLVGAVNLLFANDRTRLLAADGAQHESTLGAGVAVAKQIMPGVWLGAEVRYLRNYEGAALNVFSGQAVYLGPTIHAPLTDKLWASAAFEVQVWGGAVGVPGSLDLVNFERYQAKLRVGFNF
jgi:hypothetical protein